jgi:hypothetical protein
MHDVIYKNLLLHKDKISPAMEAYSERFYTQLNIKQGEEFGHFTSDE